MEALAAQARDQMSDGQPFHDLADLRHKDILGLALEKRPAERIRFSKKKKAKLESLFYPQ